MTKTTLFIMTVAITAPMSAATITYDFGGEVSRLTNYRGENLLPVSVGDPFFGSFDLELDTPARFNAARTEATYWGMITDVELRIGALDLTPSRDPRYPGFVAMHNDFDSGDPNLNLDGVVYQTPELTTGQNNVYRASFILRDWTAGLLDDLSPLNAAHVDFIEHDSVAGQQRLLFVDLQPGSGPSMTVEWTTFERRPISGDANCDDQVTAYDLNVIGLNWQLPADWSGGDFTRDGFVDSADLNVLALNWQHSIARPVVSGAAIPEPSGLVLTFVAICCLAFSRHHHVARV